MKMFIKRITVFLFVFAMGFAFFPVKFPIYRTAFLSCAHADDKKEDSMEKKKKKEDEGKKESHEEEEAEGEQEILVDPAAGFVDDLIIWKQTRGIIQGIKEKESSGMLKEEAREELSEAMKLLEGTVDEKFMWKTYRKRFKAGEEVIEHLEEAMEEGGLSTVELQDQVVDIFENIDSGFLTGVKNYTEDFKGVSDTIVLSLLEKPRSLIEKAKQFRRGGWRRKAVKRFRQAFPLLQKTIDANFTQEQATIIQQANKDYAIMIEAHRQQNFELVRPLLDEGGIQEFEDYFSLGGEGFSKRYADSLTPLRPTKIFGNYFVFRASSTFNEKRGGIEMIAGPGDEKRKLYWGSLP